MEMEIKNIEAAEVAQNESTEEITFDFNCVLPSLTIVHRC